MSKKCILTSCILLCLVILINLGIVFYTVPVKEYNMKLNVECTMNHNGSMKVNYILDNSELENGFPENKVSKGEYTGEGETQTVSFEIPGNTRFIRIGFEANDNIGNISAIQLVMGKKTIEVSQENYMTPLNTEMLVTESGRGTINFAIGEQENAYGYMIYDISNWVTAQQQQEGHSLYVIIAKTVLCIVIDVVFVLALVKCKKFATIPAELWQNRKLIFQLAKNDFKTKFAGSYLGSIWAFVQPIVTVLVYWFVFEKGLKAGGVNTSSGIDVPFVLWLVAGLIPWFFFQDAWNGGTNSLIEYSYLVKKVVFKISILPIVKIVSALFVHCFFIVFTIVLYCGYRYYPDLYTLQIMYYSFCTFVLVLGLSYATCALVGFFRDLTQVINIILQVGVWMTPIMWNIDTMELSPVLIKIFKLNPMYYVVAGYRDSLINKVWFWDNPSLTIYFWAVTIALFALGMFIFKRLKVHFADVL